jgi:hypothetical protein
LAVDKRFCKRLFQCIFKYKNILKNYYYHNRKQDREWKQELRRVGPVQISDVTRGEHWIWQSMGSCEGDDIRLPDHRSTDVFYSARIGLGYRYFWEQILDITIKAIMLQGIHRFAHMHVCLCISRLSILFYFVQNSRNVSYQFKKQNKTEQISYHFKSRSVPDFSAKFHPVRSGFIPYIPFRSWKVIESNWTLFNLIN